MAELHEVDTRLSEAGPLIDQWVRRGANYDVARALAPALLSEDEDVRQSAEEYLSDNLTGMGDLSPESNAAQAEAILDAEAYARSLGVTASAIPGFNARYNAREADIDAALDEALPAHMRPGYGGYPLLAETRSQSDLSRPLRRRGSRDTIDLANGPESADDYWGSGVSRPFFMDEE